MMENKVNFSTFSAVLRKIFENSPNKPKYLQIFENWSVIVGDYWASISVPQKIVNNGSQKILVLKTKRGCSLEIQHESEKILKIVNDFLGDKIFDSLLIFQMDFGETSN